MTWLLLMPLAAFTDGLYLWADLLTLLIRTVR